MEVDAVGVWYEGVGVYEPSFSIGRAVARFEDSVATMLKVGLCLTPVLDCEMHIHRTVLKSDLKAIILNGSAWPLAVALRQRSCKHEGLIVQSFVIQSIRRWHSYANIADRIDA